MGRKARKQPGRGMKRTRKRGTRKWRHTTRKGSKRKKREETKHTCGEAGPPYLG
jgi:hypothetical protein